MNDTSSQKRWRCTAQLRVSLRARRQRIRTLSFCAARRARYAAVEAILSAFFSSPQGLAKKCQRQTTSKSNPPRRRIRIGPDHLNIGPSIFQMGFPSIVGSNFYSILCLRFLVNSNVFCASITDFSGSSRVNY